MFAWQGWGKLCTQVGQDLQAHVLRMPPTHEESWRWQGPTWVMVPLTGAHTAVSIFMALITASCWPATTWVPGLTCGAVGWSVGSSVGWLIGRGLSSGVVWVVSGSQLRGALPYVGHRRARDACSQHSAFCSQPTPSIPPSLLTCTSMMVPAMGAPTDPSTARSAFSRTALRPSACG